MTTYGFKCGHCGVERIREVTGGRLATYCDSKCRVAAHRAANPERTVEYNRSYRIADPEKYRTQARDWRAANREKGSAYSKARVARVRGASEYEFFSLDEIYERDAETCYLCETYCPRDEASMDHIIPVSKGGPHTRENVALAHKVCNFRKGTKSLAEYLGFAKPTAAVL